MTEEKQLVEIHQSLIKPVLILGLEPEIAVFLMVISASLWISGKDFVSAVISIIFWIVSTIIARNINKKDSSILKTYIRHIKQQDIYPGTIKENFTKQRTKK